MANITLQGNEIHTTGNLPEVGSVAQGFTLVAEDLSENAADSETDSIRHCV